MVRRRMDPVLLVITGALFGCAAGLIAYLAKILRAGALDARPRHAVGMEPDFLTAADEPFWFYGIAALLAALAILLVGVAWRMLRHAREAR
jgi:H+/Cl- antiporter ClcA